MARVCLVLLDGLNAATARRCLTVLRALEEADKARYTELDCALPPLSRPLYVTLFSGLTPVQSGILRNDDPSPCPAPTIFSLARDAGLVTAAAAYHWVHELCNGTPYDPALHRLTDDPALPIGHGLFYDQDAYPDQALFADAACLCRRHAPDLLLAHSMGVDYAGTAVVRTAGPTVRPRGWWTVCWPAGCRSGWTRATPCWSPATTA